MRESIENTPPNPEAIRAANSKLVYDTFINALCGPSATHHDAYYVDGSNQYGQFSISNYGDFVTDKDGLEDRPSQERRLRLLNQGRASMQIMYHPDSQLPEGQGRAWAVMYPEHLYPDRFVSGIILRNLSGVLLTPGTPVVIDASCSVIDPFDVPLLKAVYDNIANADGV